MCRETPNNVTNVALTARVNEPNATVTVNGAAVGNGREVELAVGESIFEVVVTAQDGVTMLTYTVTVLPVNDPPGRTAPPTLDLTCHGYDEGATRAYNCIPVPSQQHHMGTFVPAVGSACDGGSIAEFPAGRIVVFV